MMNRIKEYMEYRRNRKIAKREMVKLAATALPVINEVNTKTTDITKFVLKLVDSAKNMSGEKLVQMVLNEVSNTLKTDNTRIIETFSYIAQQTPQDIQKVIMNAMVETNAELKDKE